MVSPIEMLAIGVTILPLMITAYLTVRSLRNGSTFNVLMRKAIFFTLLISVTVSIVMPIELPHGGGIPRLMVGAIVAAAILFTVVTTAGIYTIIKEDWT